MKVRAKDKDGNLVYGWYFYSGGTHYLMKNTAHIGIHQVSGQGCLRDTRCITEYGFVGIPDISTAAVATGKKAKNSDGKLVEIYGSMGEIRGGDYIVRLPPLDKRECETYPNRSEPIEVYWNRHLLRWSIAKQPLASYESERLEIIPPENE